MLGDYSFVCLAGLYPESLLEVKKQKLLMMIQCGGVEGSSKGSGSVGVVSTPPSEAHSQPAEEESESELHGLKCSAPLKEVGSVARGR